VKIEKIRPIKVVKRESQKKALRVDSRLMEWTELRRGQR